MSLCACSFSGNLGVRNSGSYRISERSRRVFQTEECLERERRRETAEWDSSNESSTVVQTDPELLVLLLCSFFLFYPNTSYRKPFL